MAGQQNGIPGQNRQAAKENCMNGKISAKHIPALDGIRGLAALGIFIAHYGGGSHSSYGFIRFAGEVIGFGWAAVSLFFVLSGFLISGILWESFDRENWWRRFYWRRSLRIFPLYYFALALIFTSTLWFSGHGWPLGSLWPFLVYLQNTPPLFHIMMKFPNYIALGHFWSLAVEEQFYLIWPFLLVWRRGSNIKTRRMCLLVWALSLGFRVLTYFLGMRDAWAIGFLAGRAGELAMGAYLALAIRDADIKAIVFKYARYVFSASLLAILAVIIWARSPGPRSFPMATFGLAINGILFASIIALCLQPGAVASFFSMRWLRWLGKISYGIYVYHILLNPLFAWLVSRAFPGLGHDAYFLVLAGVAAIGTLMIAGLSYYGFEAPLLRLKQPSSKRAPLADHANAG
jgi:peptidoglycan/LPS O-acetylase OafA/YrhL